MREIINRILEEAEASFSMARLRWAKVYSALVKRRLALLLSAFALFMITPVIGADQAPAPPPPSEATYGAYPHNYQEIITNWLNNALLDPNSFKVKWLGEPHPGDLNVSKTKQVSGFLVDFSINARNPFGAYTGFQKHTALIRDGQ